MATRTSLFALIAASSLGALALFTPGTANAKPIPSCGNIDFSGSEDCKFLTSGGCTGQCTAVNCEVSVEANCTGQCTGSVQASCTGTCEGNCNTQCSANPGSFSCQGSCESDCNGQCSSQCSSNSSDANCSSECQASCSARCQGSCEGTPPSATCDTQCQAECQGSCTAQANFSCDISCQSSAEASCTGGCTAQCSQPQGALFCNGQYINAPDVSQCVADLASMVDINVNVTGSGSCTNGQCTGQGTASCGQIAPGVMPPATESVFGLVFGVGLLGAVRRRAKKNAKK